jgi:hypothetical protein
MPLFAQFLVVLSTNPLWAAPCVIPPLSSAAIGQLKSNPRALMAQAADTRPLEATVRDGTDLVHLARGTNPRFQTAIAAGLAQAAIASQAVHQGAGLQIQHAVAGFMDGQIQKVFATVAGDLSTAATDAAPGASKGSAGSVIVTNPTMPAGLPNTLGSGITSLFDINSSGVAFAPTTATTRTATTTA